MSIRMIALFTIVAASATVASEQELIKVEVSPSCHGPAYLHYKEGIVWPILEPFKNPDGVPMTRVARAVLERGSTDTLTITFDDDPSCDPAFKFHWSDGKRVEIKSRLESFAVLAVNLIIPGDGYFYASGHTNTHFDKRRKFHLVDSVIVEVEQPYYYVGLKTVALRDIKLYGDLVGDSIVAEVSAEDSIVVLLNAGYSFLVKARYDIIGWWRIREPSWQWPTEVDGVFYRGD
jgi:hypothetical protein